MIRRLWNHPFLLWFGAGLFLAGGFLEFTDLFLEGSEPGRFDLFVLRKVAEWRTPVLTTIFINLTALGSWTLISLHTIIAFSLLVSTRDRMAAFHLAAATAGAIVLMELTKGYIGRARPTVVPALVEAFGTSRMRQAESCTERHGRWLSPDSFLWSNVNPVHTSNKNPMARFL